MEGGCPVSRGPHPMMPLLVDIRRGNNLRLIYRRWGRLGGAAPEVNAFRPLVESRATAARVLPVAPNFVLPAAGTRYDGTIPSSWDMRLSFGWRF